MAHTASEGKAMVCIKCKGQMIVWEKDKLKHQKVLLSVMQQNGQSVAKKLAEIKKNKRKEWSLRPHKSFCSFEMMKNT